MTKAVYPALLGAFLAVSGAAQAESLKQKLRSYPKPIRCDGQTYFVPAPVCGPDKLVGRFKACVYVKTEGQLGPVPLIIIEKRTVVNQPATPETIEHFERKIPWLRQRYPAEANHIIEQLQKARAAQKALKCETPIG